MLVFSITGTVATGSMTAYAIDRVDFRMKKLMVTLFLAATQCPVSPAGSPPSR
ncbi:hypothetical protein ACFWBX_12345 [Streptomyces sp. NPDC059991]|uniref:hypothetical protein n=1 Tax=Streptomyces sp. NPDC059991 TaxID=3347028 RepID=UPI0036BF4277